MAFTEELDARDLRCPMPLLKLKQALHRLQPGDQVRLLATDPGAERDVPAFARQAGHRLLSQSQRAQTYQFIIEKCGNTL